MTEDMPAFLRTGPENSKPPVVLAHGAGAGMRSDFMEAFALGLGDRGIAVLRFEFPYMQEMSKTGRRRPPSAAGALQRYWIDVVRGLSPLRPVIGGKSLGGRIASMIADECDVAGLVCLGYPFHPPGKPQKTRTEHLRGLQTPALFCQGTRDPFGTAEDIAAYDLSRAITMKWLEDGNHSLEPRRKSGRTAQDNWGEAMDRIASFVRDL